MGVIYDSVIKTVKKKKYRQFLLISFDDFDKAIDQFHILRKKVKKVGGISLLDESFTAEYVDNLKIKKAGKYVILINILSNSAKSFDKAKEKLSKSIESLSIIELPCEDYDKQLDEFWMLRVFIYLMQ